MQGLASLSGLLCKEFLSAIWEFATVFSGESQNRDFTRCYESVQHVREGPR